MALNINGTTGISGVDGSASAPALQGTDSNTGINFAADTVNINTGGVTRATINSNGRLLVGTTTEGNDSATELVLNGSSNVGMTVRSSSSNAGSVFFSDGTSGGDEYRGYVQYEHANDAMTFGTDATERMRIDSSGNLRFAQSTSTSPAQSGVAGICLTNYGRAEIFAGANVGIVLNRTNTGDIQQFRRNALVKGEINVNASRTAYNTESDYRLKENITTLSDGITRLKTLKPSRFNFKEDPNNTVEGFIAHELQTVIPEAVSGTKDEVDSEGQPKYQGVDTSFVVPLLTAALQEAVAKIEVLETKVAALEAA